MKRRVGIVLQLISLVTLSGCNFIRVDHNKALDRITEISDNYVYVKGVQSLQTESSLEITTEKKSSSEEINMKYTVETYLKVFTPIYFLYKRTTIKCEDLITGHSVLDEIVTWKFKRGTQFYLLTSKTVHNEETKTYNAIEANEENKNNLKKEMKDEINLSFNSKDRDDCIDVSMEVINRDAIGENIKTKYITYGHGDLTVVASAENSVTNENIDSFSKENYYIEWKKYSLRNESSFVVESTTNRETNEYSKVTTKTSHSFKTFVIPTFPKIKQFKK